MDTNGIVFDKAWLEAPKEVDPNFKGSHYEEFGLSDKLCPTCHAHLKEEDGLGLYCLNVCHLGKEAKALFEMMFPKTANVNVEEMLGKSKPTVEDILGALMGFVEMESEDVPSEAHVIVVNGGHPLFEMGVICATRGAETFLREQGLEPSEFIVRHVCGDWQGTPKRLNEHAIKNGLRIVSFFETPKGDVFLITEADRSATTLMLSEEY